MGTEHPAEGGEKKPAVKNEDGNGGGSYNCRNNFDQRNKFAKKERFMGAHPDLQGFVFEANAVHLNQITNFNTIDTRIRALIGQQFDPFVLESIEKMAVTMPPEPTINTEADGVTISRVEEIKYGKKFD